jgi:hypothetical protein
MNQAGMSPPNREPRREQLRRRILDLVGEYCAEAFPAKPFLPGDSAVPVSGKVFDASEMRLLVDSALDFWLTTGPVCRPVRTLLRQLVRPARVRAGELGFVGQPAGRLGAHVAQTGRPPLDAGRRSDHGRRRISPPR